MWQHEIVYDRSWSRSYLINGKTLRIIREPEISIIKNVTVFSEKKKNNNKFQRKVEVKSN